MPQHPAQRRGWPQEQVTEFIDQLSSGGRGLQAARRAAAGDHLHGRDGRARALALRQPAARGDPRLHPGGVDRRPRSLGRAPASRRSRAGARAGEPQDARRPQPAARRLPNADPRRRGRLDPRRGGARGRRIRRPGLARRPLRHHRAQERRAGAAAGRRAAGDRRPARGDRAQGRRLRGPDGGGRRPAHRDRRRGQRLHLGGRAGRAPPPSPRRAEGSARRRRPARLGGARLARGRRARVAACT